MLWTMGNGNTVIHVLFSDLTVLFSFAILMLKYTLFQVTPLIRRYLTGSLNFVSF